MNTFPKAEVLYIDMGMPVYFDEGGYKVYRNPRWDGDPKPYVVSEMGYGRVDSFATPEEATAAASALIKLREPSLLRESGMDERAKAIAEEAAAKAVMLQGNQIAQQVAKELSGEVLHQSPLSTHCLAVLEAPPKCFDFRGARSFCLCWAWKEMEEKKLSHLPVREAWQELRRVCQTG